MTHDLLFLSGTRADFGKLEPLATAARDAGHRVTFFVMGTHMMEAYGLTELEVSRMPGVADLMTLDRTEGQTILEFRRDLAIDGLHGFGERREVSD